MIKKNHSEKFKRWQTKVCPQTQYLSKLVDEKLVPFFESKGFVRVNHWLNDPERGVSIDSIGLERAFNDKIDSVDISFVKYGKPKFQIGFSRREADKPYNFVRSGCLVKNKKQYYFFWGKPWWFPLRLWSESKSKKLVTRIISMLPQVLEFIENERLDTNISSQV